MTMTEDAETWRERAAEIHERGGVGMRQAQVAVLIEAGLTHQEVADELGLDQRSEVSTHVRRYRRNREAAAWLAESAPEI